MDPKASAQLDPKLQEAYNRVMGIATTSGQTVASAPVTPSAAVQPPGAQTSSPATPSVVTPISPAMPNLTTPSLPSQPQPETETLTTANNQNPEKPHAFVAKSNTASNRKISPVILAVGGVAFLLLYTVLWIKIFNLSVPFVNQ